MVDDDVVAIPRFAIDHLFDYSWHHRIDQRAFRTSEVYTIMESFLHSRNRITPVAIVRCDMDEIQWKGD